MFLKVMTLAFEDTIAVMLLGAGWFFYRVTGDIDESDIGGLGIKIVGQGVAIWMSVLGLGYALTVANQNAIANYQSITGTAFIVVIGPAILITAWFTIIYLAKIFKLYQVYIAQSRLSKGARQQSLPPRNIG